MNSENLIPAIELCTRYKVEHTFIESLHESGLLEVIIIEKTAYVHYDAIPEFEKMHRLYYDLNINLEGLEAVKHLLQQVQKLQKQNQKLRNRLSLYEKP